MTASRGPNNTVELSNANGYADGDFERNCTINSLNRLSLKYQRNEKQ